MLFYTINIYIFKSIDIKEITKIKFVLYFKKEKSIIYNLFIFSYNMKMMFGFLVFYIRHMLLSHEK
jgi:hypothetical protein